MSRPKPATSRQGNSNNKVMISRATSLAPVPDPPGTLGPYGANLWRQLWESGRGVYAETDRMILERYCSLSERRRLLLSVLEDEGFLTQGSQGQTVAHPAARLVTEVESRLGPIEDRLGLSPESRMALGLTAIAHQDALTTFLEGGDP